MVFCNSTYVTRDAKIKSDTSLMPQIQCIKIKIVHLDWIEIVHHAN